MKISASIKNINCVFRDISELIVCLDIEDGEGQRFSFNMHTLKAEKLKRDLVSMFKCQK